MGRDLNWKDTDLDFGVSVVMKKLQLNPDKSSGPEAFHPLLFKDCATVLAEPLVDDFPTVILKQEHCWLIGRRLILYRFSRKEIEHTEQIIVQSP